MVRLSRSVHGRLHSDHKELSVHEGPLGAAEQWDQALIWLRRCLPPRGREPCVSTKIAQAHFPKHRDTITLTDGLFGCSALINTNDAPMKFWLSFRFYRHLTNWIFGCHTEASYAAPEMNISIVNFKDGRPPSQ